MKKIEIWVNRTQNAVKIKKKPTPLWHLHRENNRKFEIWTNLQWKRPQNALKTQNNPLCDLYRNRTFRILANLLWNRNQNTCDLHRGKNWKLQIWVSLICNIAQNANKVKITPLCDVHRGRNRKFEIWFNWFWKRARNEMKIRNPPCMWFT